MDLARALAACSAVALACGPTPGTTTDASTGAATTAADSTSTAATAPTTTQAGTTGPDTGATTTGATTTGATTSTDTDAGSETSSSAGSSGDATTGAASCEEPDDPAVEAAWTLTVDGGLAPEAVLAPCVVVTSEVQDTQWLLALDCEIDGGTKAVELVITRAPAMGPTLAVGDERVLDYRRTSPFWSNEWFAIHPADNPFITNVSGIQAEALAPPDTTAVEFFGVDIAVIDDLCAPIDTGPCGPSIRLALEMKWSAATDLVFDGQTGSLTDFGGTISSHVAIARRPDDGVQCDDLPPAWFSVVMAGNFGP